MSGELEGMADPPCMVGFAQIPAALYGTVSHRAIVLWGLLDIHQGGRAGTHPSKEHLADDLGWSLPTVKRTLRELTSAGWLEVDVSRGRGNANTYNVLGRPRKGVTADPISAVENPRKGVTSAPFSAVDNSEKGSPVNEKGVTSDPPTIGRTIGGTRSGNSTTDRARESVDKCEHGRPLAADDRSPSCSVCAEQRQLWPTAVGE